MINKKDLIELINTAFPDEEEVKEEVVEGLPKEEEIKEDTDTLLLFGTQNKRR